MPQPRKYKTNAERQAAYRVRKADREARVSRAPVVHPALVGRVLAADARASAAEAR